jgi:NADH:ubiquinone oxidoreductase subunit E
MAADPRAKTTVTVCVGSSCHVRGSRELIRRFDQIIREEHLGDSVELKGSFCMERCGQGFNWQIDEEPFTSLSVAEAEAVLRQKVVGPRRAASRGS